MDHSSLIREKVMSQNSALKCLYYPYSTYAFLLFLANHTIDPIGYWKSWKLFEEAHGNEDTYRDMLRVKRSVEIAYSQVRCCY